MSTLTNDLARLANNANVLVGAITTNSSAITSVNVGGLSINSSGIAGDLNISGNLTVTGTTVTVNTTTLDVKDLNITIAKGAGSAAAANGAGITVDTGYANLYYDSTANAWTTNIGLNVSSGNVGIGTTSPAYKLSVNGTTYLGGVVNVGTTVSVSTSQINVTNGSINSTMYHNGLVIGTGRTIPSGGGITIDGNQGINNDFVANNRTAGIGAGWGVIRVMPSSSADGIKIYGDDSQTTNYFTVDSKNAGANTFSSVFAITSTGNVGIGINTPSYALDVYRGNSTVPVTVAKFGTIGNGNTNRGTKLLISAGGLSSNVDVVELVGYQEAACTVANAASFAINVANSTGGLVERLRIDNGGDVGIATNNPTQKLHVNGNILIENNYGLLSKSSDGTLVTVAQVYSDNVTRFYSASSTGVMYFNPDKTNSPTYINYNNGGLVQIGNGTLNNKVYIRGIDTFPLNVYNDKTPSTAAESDCFVTFQNYYGVTQISNWQNLGMRIGSRSIKNGGNGHIYFTVAGDAIHSMMAANGNFGIGTVSPSTTLSVAGNVYISGQVVANGGAQALSLSAGPTSNHVYMSFYARSTALTTRSGYMGFGGGGSAEFNIVNEISGGDVKIFTANTGYIHISAAGAIGFNVAAGTRNNTTLNIASGIGFPATAVASSDANTLDDYEEGTWTPTLSFNDVAHDGSYSYQTGYYTKIGNLVCVSGIVGISTAGTRTGAARLTNLPFVVGSASCGPISSLYNSMSSINYCIAGDFSGTAAVVLYTGTTTGFSTLQKTNFTAGAANYIQFNFVYRA